MRLPVLETAANACLVKQSLHADVKTPRSLDQVRKRVKLSASGLGG